MTGRDSPAALASRHHNFPGGRYQVGHTYADRKYFNLESVTVAGQMIGSGTRLIRVLGRGSHSVVYLAVTGRGQVRAVKIFPPELAAFAEREYEHGAGLTHPRLAPVLDRTAIGGQPTLLVAYARGHVLFERYRRRPALTRERQAFLLTLVHVLEALAYLHGRGTVHRDVKPDNIIVEEDGSAKLVDYDLSGPIGETLGGKVRIGTPAFQSPEAQRGEPQSQESDLYSVGILLYWGLYGQLPDPTDPSNPVNDPLVSLMETLCHPDRHARPQDASLVKRELLRLVQDSFL